MQTNDFPSLKTFVLDLLSEQPNLSTKQLQILTGTKLKTIQKCLTNLSKKRVIMGRRYQEWQSYLWRLKRVKEIPLDKLFHEQMGINQYVSLKQTKVPMAWTDKDDHRRGFSFDKALEMFGKRFFFEMETGSHYYKREKVIRKKIEQYMKLEGRFHVIFEVSDYAGVPARKYGEEILGIIREYHRGSQFLVSPYDALVKDPLSNWLIHPNGKVYSLETIS